MKRLLNLSLKQLRLFLAIAQQGTVTQAAETLFMSKPAVSVALSELEKQLGHLLFDRHKGRLIINDIGRGILPLVVELLDRSEEIKRLTDPTNVGTLRIGASLTIGNYMAPFILRQFRVSYPSSEQTLQVLNTAVIVKALLDFELDVGLIEGTVHDSRLELVKWFQDDMVLICAKHHPLAKMRKIDFKKLNNQQWVLRENGSGTRDYFNHHIASKLKQWQLSLELNSLSALISAVMAGFGITCISKVAVEHLLPSKKLAVLDFSLPSRPYWLAYTKNKYQSSSLKCFVDYCRQWKQ